MNMQWPDGLQRMLTQPATPAAPPPPPTQGLREAVAGLATHVRERAPFSRSGLYALYVAIYAPWKRPGPAPALRLLGHLQRAGVGERRFTADVCKDYGVAMSTACSALSLPWWLCLALAAPHLKRESTALVVAMCEDPAGGRPNFVIQVAPRGARAVMELRTVTGVLVHRCAVTVRRLLSGEHKTGPAWMETLVRNHELASNAGR